MEDVFLNRRNPIIQVPPKLQNDPIVHLDPLWRFADVVLLHLFAISLSKSSKFNASRLSSVKIVIGTFWMPVLDTQEVRCGFCVRGRF